MKHFRLIIFIINFIVIFSTPSLFASGKTDAGEEQTINNEWILLVTAFDKSGLPPAQRIAGDVMIRDLVNKLRAVSYRLRISPEYAYYEGYAWRQSVSVAAKALSNKREERSQLIYRGEPEWRYRRNLQRIDADIEKLTEDYEKKLAEKPLVNIEPAFSLSQTNIGGTYPEPPIPDNEYRFCQNQKADAFLAGQIREFHGRFYIKLNLYVLYTQSYIYEDDIIFSIDDVAGAVDEIAARLTAVLSGNKPAAVAVNADLPDAQILINQNYAGTGAVPGREHPPGKITVAVTAEGYQGEVVETELLAGELTEIDVHLSPLYYAEVNIGAKPEGQDIFVYHGALYVGTAPLTLRLPIDRLEYISLEQKDGMAAKAVFTSPEMPGETVDFSLTLKIQPPSGERRVNKARGQAYWAWGSVWLTGIAAWVSNGIYATQMEGSQKQLWNGINIGSIGLLGAAIVYNLIQMPRYLYTANENTTPIVK